MIIVSRHFVDIFSIVTFIVIILALAFFIAMAIFFYDISQLRTMSEFTATTIFAITIVMIAILVSLIIYAIVHMSTNKILVKVSKAQTGDVVQGCDSCPAEIKVIPPATSTVTSTTSKTPSSVSITKSETTKSSITPLPVPF